VAVPLQQAYETLRQILGSDVPDVDEVERYVMGLLRLEREYGGSMLQVFTLAQYEAEHPGKMTAFAKVLMPRITQSHVFKKVEYNIDSVTNLVDTSEVHILYLVVKWNSRTLRQPLAAWDKLGKQILIPPCSQFAAARTS
jgi:hypothetical protein